MLSQQERPLAEAARLSSAAETVGVSSLQEEHLPAAEHTGSFPAPISLNLCKWSEKAA